MSSSLRQARLGRVIGDGLTPHMGLLIANLLERLFKLRLKRATE
jgi:hypothetical protein